MAESVPRERGEVLIVTGMSGAGRSTVANALEDLDWYVVDNLPPQMLKPMLDLSGLAGAALPRVAAVVDVRGRGLFTELPDIKDGRMAIPTGPGWGTELNEKVARAHAWSG